MPVQRIAREADRLDLVGYLRQNAMPERGAQHSGSTEK
jgi:hypothetical protein